MTTIAIDPRAIVEQYFAHGYSPVFWLGDSKGPRDEGWPDTDYAMTNYRSGCRVGLKTGTKISDGSFIHDVDIDWAAGRCIAQDLLPPTDFRFGRTSKPVSHCFYALPEALPSLRYEDIDKTCLIEFRGTKADGTIGHQTMVPPSIWSKGEQREPLFFRIAVNGRIPTPAFIPLPSTLTRSVLLVAISMLLAKHLGHNGFGHEPRLAWAGFLLRLGFAVEELVRMGKAISVYCNNREVDDVRRAVESTAAALTVEGKKVKGGPALAKIIGPNGKKVIDRIREWLGHRDDFYRDESGRIVKDSQDNIVRVLRLMNVVLSYHEFAERMLITQDERTQLVDDSVTERLWLQIDRDYRFRPQQQFFEIVVRSIARDNPFHAVRDYLDALRWDSTKRIDTWLIKYAGAADTPYTRAVSSIVLIAGVRRVRLPGCKYDEIVVLESAQGLNKSSALRALCPDESWFSDDLPLNVDSKQVIERTLGKWIIEASDLAGKRKAENEQLKAMLSRQVDGPARMAYARNPIERPRQFIIVGTTNSSEYLPDPTGARRYWPVAIKQFNLVELKRDRDQLWAEAAVRESQGESIRLPENLWPQAAEEQEQRRELDPWEETIRLLLVNMQPSSDGRKRIATTLIWDAFGIPSDRRDRPGAIRISEIMQRLGFKRGRVTHDGEKQVGYVEIAADNLIAMREPGDDDDDVPF